MEQQLLTPERLQTFVGGQVEVQNQNEGYVYRGEIAQIAVSQDTSGLSSSEDLVIDLKWMAKLNPATGEWVTDPDLRYAVSLMIYAVRDIGEGRLFLSCWMNGEAATLFPKGGSRLEESRLVEPK